MDCGGLPPLCEARRVEAGFPTGRRPSPRVEVGALGTRAGRGPLRAGNGGPVGWYISAGAPGAERRPEHATVETMTGLWAVEASCKEDPCPFQQTGQFWTPASEVALLGLDTFWRTRRRSVLLRHSRPAKGAKIEMRRLDPGLWKRDCLSLWPVAGKRGDRTKITWRKRNRLS